MRVPTTADPRLRREIEKADRWIEAASQALRFIPAINNPGAQPGGFVGSGTDVSTLLDHDHSRTGMGGNILGADGGSMDARGSWLLKYRAAINSVLAPYRLFVVGDSPSVNKWFPTGDLADAVWTNQAGSGVNRWQSIDETILDTADFVQSDGPLPSTTKYEATLPPVTDPGTDGGLSVRIRAKCASGAQQFELHLMEGGSTRAVRTPLILTTSYAEYVIDLTVLEAASISNWSDLRIRFGRGGLGQISQLFVAQAYFQTPGSGLGTKTVVFKSGVNQTENLFDAQTSAGTDAISISSLGKLIIQAAGALQMITGAALGAILKSDAAGNLTLFPHGTAYQFLRTNAGGTDLEYATPPETTGAYGDGIDGDVTLDGTATYTTIGISKSGNNYFMSRSLYLNNLTVDSGKTLECGAWLLIVKNTLTNNGTIFRQGSVGGNGANASGAGVTVGGAGGAGIAGGSISLGAPLGGGAAGSGGRNGTKAAGASGTTGGAAAGEGGNGGAGGRGENSNTGAAGGNGGAASTTTIARFRTLGVVQARDFQTIVDGGSGGSGGGSGGSDGVAWSGAGGGGGGGGGSVLVYARILINSGTIHADGGAGGNGGNTDGSEGAGGGGGGGGGGFVTVMYDSLTGAGTIRAAGGAAGAVGTQGTGGTAGSNGSAGAAGTVIKYNRLSGVYS